MFMPTSCVHTQTSPDAPSSQPGSPSLVAPQYHPRMEPSDYCTGHPFIEQICVLRSILCMLLLLCGEGKGGKLDIMAVKMRSRAGEQCHSQFALRCHSLPPSLDHRGMATLNLIPRVSSTKSSKKFHVDKN